MKNIDKSLVTALDIAEKEMKYYSMTKAYDCGDFYYFSCIRIIDGQEGNGPTIDKITLKPRNIDSASLISTLCNCTYIADVDEIRKHTEKLNRSSKENQEKNAQSD